MSYEIYYQRRFIKVREWYIPLFQQGSNNCFEFNWNGREISEKKWHVLNYKREGQLLFNENEIRELANMYDGFEPAKARHNWFEKGEFERWFINGMKSAQPLEYYLALGNHAYLLDYTVYPNYVKYPVSSTEEMVAKWEELRAEGKQVDLKFEERDLRLPKRVRNHRPKQVLSSYYTIVNEGRYLYKLTKNGYQYTGYVTSGTKKFKTEREALRYLEKYGSRLSGFVVEYIPEKTA